MSNLEIGLRVVIHDTCCPSVGSCPRPPPLQRSLLLVSVKSLKTYCLRDFERN